MKIESSKQDLSAARQGREPIAVGDWVLHADLGELRRGKEEQRLTAKALHVLLVLVDADGAAVSREQLLDSVWGDSYPSDAVVSRAIADLRAALGEAAGDQVYIRTVPKFGYQLLSNRTDSVATSGRSRWAIGAAIAALLTVAAVVWWPTEVVEEQAPFRLPAAQPLTANPGLEHQPRHVADSDWIVYAALRPDQGDWDLFRISSSDGSTQAIAALPGVNEHGPAVSGSGEEVAYVRLEGSTCDVVVQSVAFGIPETIASCTNKFPTLVDWAPNGDWIAYTGLESDDAQGYRRLYRVNRSSREKLRLSDAVSATGSDFYPRFSPSGEQVAFLRGEPQPDHRSSLWLVELQTGIERRLTPQPAQLGGMTWISEHSILYSINNAGHFESRLLDLNSGVERSLAAPDLIHPEFDANRGVLIAASRRSERDLAIVAADGSVTAIASSTSDDHDGTFQPGGEFAAYISRRSGNDEIWLVDIADTTARQLTHIEGATIRYPAWHPDGLHILFTLQNSAGERLYEIDVLSGAMQQIGDPDHEVTTPRWSEDGSHWLMGCRDDAGWGVCVADYKHSEMLAHGYFRPTPIDAETVAVIDNNGILYRLSIRDGSVESIWDGLPALGRFSWTIVGDILYYVESINTNISAHIVRRDLGNGSETVLFEGRMPLANTRLSVSRANGAILFTRLQAASDDLVRFDVAGSTVLTD